MKTLLRNLRLGILVLALTSTSVSVGSAQKQTPLIVKGEVDAVEIDLRVNGVGLGASHDLVRRQLGKPLRTRDRQELDETCGPAHIERTLEYNGLTVVMHGTLDRRRFGVVSMKVTSRRWLVSSRLRIGMTFAQATTVLGTVDVDTRTDDIRKLDYTNIGNDGGATLTFKNEKLVLIDWEAALC